MRIQNMSNTFQKLKNIILRVSGYLEIAIALFLVIITVALFVKFIFAVILEGPTSWNQGTIHNIVQDSFNLIIALEFIRMLLKHSIGSILEIVLFSVARGLVVDHSTGIETVLIVFALGLVLLIRKYLLLPHDLEYSISDSEHGH